jgi:hypothetical protein
MVVISTIRGDLLKCVEPTICHQCNCVTIFPHGLSKTLFERYPWANTYGRRPRKTKNCTNTPSIPGTIEIDSEPEKRVIHLFGQIFPGKPGVHGKHYASVEGKDDRYDRVAYFKSCLDALDAMELKEPVAMPYRIGCDLAGGDWLVYSHMLRKCKTRIVLYRLK